MKNPFLKIFIFTILILAGINLYRFFLTPGTPQIPEVTKRLVQNGFEDLNEKLIDSVQLEPNASGYLIVKYPERDINNK